MKRKIILPVVAVVMLAILYGPWLLLLLLAIPIGMYVANYMNKRDEIIDSTPAYATIDDVTALYGEPDDVVVLDVARANELNDLILFYDDRGLAIIDRHEIPIARITGVAPKNLAIAGYMPEDYGLVVNTLVPCHTTMRLSVRGDMRLAQSLASQVVSHLKTRTSAE